MNEIHEIETETTAGHGDTAAEPPIPSRKVWLPFYFMGAMRPPFWQALANLKQGIRGAVLAPVLPENFRATWSQLIILTALNVAAKFALDFIRVGTQGELTQYGLPGALFGLPVILFASWAVARLATRPDQTLLLAVVFSAIAIPVDVSYQTLYWIFNSLMIRDFSFFWGSFAFYSVSAWFALASAVVATRLLGVVPRQRIVIFFLTGILIGTPLSLVYRNTTLWVLPFDEQAYQDEQKQKFVLENEDVFYLQPKLLEHELAALKPGRKNRVNLYFVGVAGYSEQDVFMKEVNYVSNFFKSRYVTEGHSVRLINNAKTVTELPIASTTSLRLTLKRIGQVMDRNKDILFLFLTSHGSKDHKFSLELGAMQFNQLDPKRLRDMLDKSGIKKRVIVISACYSGGFVDALKTTHSLVITSAAPEKQSFGCNNEAEFTYFGRAYFSEALHKTDSFIEAFNLATAAISQREAAENFEHSDPRMFVGSDIQTSIQQLKVMKMEKESLQ